MIGPPSFVFLQPVDKPVAATIMNTNRPNTSGVPSSSSTAGPLALRSGSTAGVVGGTDAGRSGSRSMDYNPFSLMDVGTAKIGFEQFHGVPSSMPMQQQQRGVPTTATSMGSAVDCQLRKSSAGTQQGDHSYYQQQRQPSLSQPQQRTNLSLDLARVTQLASQRSGSAITTTRQDIVTPSSANRSVSQSSALDLKTRGGSLDTVTSMRSGTDGEPHGRVAKRSAIFSNFLKRDPPDFLKPSPNTLLRRQGSSTAVTARGLFGDQSRSGSTATNPDAHVSRPQHQEQLLDPSPSQGYSPGFVLHTARERDRVKPAFFSDSALTARPSAEDTSTRFVSSEQCVSPLPSSTNQATASHLPQGPPLGVNNPGATEPHFIDSGSASTVVSTATGTHLPHGSDSVVSAPNALTSDFHVPQMDIAVRGVLGDTRLSNATTSSASQSLAYLTPGAEVAVSENYAEKNNILVSRPPSAPHAHMPLPADPRVGSVLSADNVAMNRGDALGLPMPQGIPNDGLSPNGTEETALALPRPPFPGFGHPHKVCPAAVVPAGDDVAAPHVTSATHGLGFPPTGRQRQERTEHDTQACVFIDGFDPSEAPPAAPSYGDAVDGSSSQEWHDGSLQDAVATAPSNVGSEALLFEGPTQAGEVGTNMCPVEEGTSPEARLPALDMAALPVSSRREGKGWGQQHRPRGGAPCFAVFSPTGCVIAVFNAPNPSVKPRFVCSRVADILSGKAKGMNPSKVGEDYVTTLRVSAVFTLRKINENKVPLTSLREAVQQVPDILPLLRGVLSYALRDPLPDWRNGGQKELTKMLSEVAEQVPPSSVMNPIRLSDPNLLKRDPEQGLREVQRLLLIGEREAAVGVAMEFQLYTHAIIISMVCPTKEQYMDVIRTVVEKELSPLSPLAHAYCTFNELPLPGFASSPTSTLPSAPTGGCEVCVRQSWVQHAALFVSNFTRESAVGLVQLGDALVKEGLIDEAYCCFLLAHLTPMGNVAPQQLPQPQQQHVMNLLRVRLGALGGHCRPDGVRVVLTPKLLFLADVVDNIRCNLEVSAQPAATEGEGLVMRHGLPARSPASKVVFCYLQMLWLQEVGLHDMADPFMAHTLRMAPTSSKNSAPFTLNRLLASGPPVPAPATATDAAVAPVPIPTPGTPQLKTAPPAPGLLNKGIGPRFGAQTSQRVLPRIGPDGYRVTTVPTAPQTSPPVPMLAGAFTPNAPGGAQTAGSSIPPPPASFQSKVVSTAPPPPPLSCQVKSVPEGGAVESEPTNPNSASSSSTSFPAAPPTTARGRPAEPGPTQDPGNNERTQEPKKQQRQQPPRSGSLGALASFLFRRSGSKDNEAKKDEPKKMIIDTEKPPKFDPTRGCYLFPESEEDKKVAEMIKAGPMMRFSVKQQAPQGPVNRRMPVRTKYVDTFNSS